jgi:hypothetical protein
MHSRFLPFLSSAVELPASCAGAVLCGRLPHMNTGKMVIFGKICGLSFFGAAL